ncbi:unnamed protein product [Prorocentrum cordatum]|uniref:Receptor ligand binding region domain-containing protein n=1 Tax=Prorocentrum cordatum TaxID=2364126 RepID=A0ABN9XI69_9DINO|nr:unnamed protein product [Polarella glacialis]
MPVVTKLALAAAVAVAAAGEGSKLGVNDGPAYYNKANLRLGGVDHITRLGESCGFMDTAYQSMAIKHVNERNSNWCRAIGDLSEGWDMSLVLLDATEQETGDSPPKAALSAGLKLVGSTPEAQVPLMSWAGTEVAPWNESNFSGASTNILPVHGILGPSYSGTTMKTSSFFDSFNVPIMSNYATNPAMSQKSGNSAYPNFWRTCPPDSLKMDMVAVWLQSWGISKVFVVTIDDSFPIGMRDALLGYCPKYGLTCATASSLVPAASASQTDVLLDDLMDEFAASGTRTIVLNGLVAQNSKIMRALNSRGLSDGDQGYIVVHPEFIGTSEVDFEGAFAVLPSHEIAAAWQAAYGMVPPLTEFVKPFVNGGGFANESFVYTPFEQSPICGTQQDVLCSSTSIGHSGMMGAEGSDNENRAHFTWHEVKDDFEACSAYGPLGYDSVVSYAAAFDIGVRLHKANHSQGFDKDSVTPEKLMAMLHILTQGVDTDGENVSLDKDGDGLADTPVKEFYGTCLGSGGPIGFEWRDGMRQERSSHFSVVNYRTAPGNAAELIGHPTWDMYTASSSETPLLVERGAAAAGVKFGTGTVLGYPRNDGMLLGMPPVCPPGQYLDPDVSSCKATSPGYYQPLEGQDSELACPPGFSCESGGCADQCDACALGKFQNQSGQATCEPCPAGSAAGTPGSASCSPCPPGEFAGLAGMASCAACPIGQVQTAAGRSSCEACPSGRTTFEKSASLLASCLCLEGTMDPDAPMLTVADASGSLVDVATKDDLAICQACPEGFECPLGSSFYDALGENHVLHGYVEPDASQVNIVPVSRPNMAVAQGYYLAAGYQSSAGSASDKLALNIYLCDGLGIQQLSQEGYVSPCPGGPADACDNGREGIACAKCAEGSYATVDGPCAKCDGWEPAILVLVALAGFIAVVASYYFINGPLNGQLSPLMVLAMCAGTFVMTLQSCAALASLSISYPDGLGGLFAGTRLFALDLRALRPECTLGSSVIAGYALKVGLPWFLFALFSVLCVLSKLLPERWQWETSKTFNTVCNFFQAAFITIILTVIGPFRTFAHPGSGDRSSMLSSPDIDTSSGTYVGLVVFAVFGLLPCFLFIALYVFSVKKSPAWRETDMVKHLQAIKFVLFRFEAHAYYWGLCFLARSTAVSIITLLPNPFTQLLLLSVVMVVYLVALCLVWPWRAPVVNVLDALQTTLLLVILLAATRPVGADNGGEDADAVTGLISACYVVLLLAFGVAGVFAVRGQLDMGEGRAAGADGIPERSGGEADAGRGADDDAVEIDEKPSGEVADSKDRREHADGPRVEVSSQV